MAINISVEVTGGARQGIEDLKRRLIELIQRAKALGQQAKESTSEIESGFKRADISGRDLTKTIAKISSAVLFVGGIGVRAFTSIAEKTKDSNIESLKFLIAIENFKKRVEDAVQVVLPFLNKFLDLTQVAATQQQINNAQLDAFIEKYKKLRDTRTPAEEMWLKIHDRVLQGLQDEKEKREKLLRLQKEEAERRAEALRQRQDDFKLRVLDMLDDQAVKDEELITLQDQITAAIDRTAQAATKFDDSRRVESYEEFNEVIRRQTDSIVGQERALVMLGQVGVNSLTNMVFYSRSLDESLKGVGVSIAQLLVRFALFQSLGGQFGAGGILNQIFGFKKGGIIPDDIPHAQRGLIVRRPTLVATGEGSQPEAIVPLAPNRARDRARVLNEAGLNTGGNVTVNLNLPNVSFLDPVTLRNRIMPEINRQVRRGERLVSSSTL